MLPNTNAQSEQMFHKLDNAFNEIFGTSGAPHRSKPNAPQQLRPALDLARQESDWVKQLNDYPGYFRR